jgi:two-component sensor histidine kinase/PAS domain-containing protein
MNKKGNPMNDVLKLALSLSSDGFIILDNLHVIWVNERAREIVGETVQKLEGTSIDDLFSEGVKKKILTQKEVGNIEPLEVNFPSKGVYDLRIQKLEYDSNYWSICINDRGEYKRLARSSERAQLSLKNLLDNLNEGVLLLFKGNIEFINTQGADILKEPVDSCIGKSFLSFIYKGHQRKLIQRIENTELGVLTAYEEFRTIHADEEADIGVSMVLTVYDDKPMVQLTLSDLRLRNILKKEQVRAETLQISNAALLNEIEEHKKTKDKLIKQQTETKEQKTRLQAVYDSSGDALMCAIDNRGLIMVRNKTLLIWSEKHLGDPIQPGDNLYKFLFEHRLQEKYQQELQKAQDNIGKVPVQNFEIALRSTKGKDIWLVVHIAMMRSAHGRKEFSVMMFDNTEKRAADKRIRDSLLEKEVLLKEVHHRVKNNIQLISSILSLQSSYTDNEEVTSILSECRRRIQSMAFIHEMIYRNPDFNGIDAAEYIGLLCRQLIQGYGPANTKLTYTQDIDHSLLTLDEAIPTGLIINELLSNALKHAFVNRKEGALSVRLKESGGKLHLSVMDDGVGMKEDLGDIQTDSLGAQLVIALTQQLDGELSTERISGTTIKIVFPKRR